MRRGGLRGGVLQCWEQLGPASWALISVLPLAESFTLPDIGHFLTCSVRLQPARWLSDATSLSNHAAGLALPLVSGKTLG